MLEQITTAIEQYLGIQVDVQTKIVFTLVIIAAVMLLRVLTNRFINRRFEETATIYRWRKSSGYLFWGLGIVAIGLVWMRGAGSIATYLGLVSAALVIALQDPISNFVGWVFIVSRRPFEIEDRIEIGQEAGDVIDIRFFQFSLLEIGNWVDADQSTGRVLHIPNRRVFAENVANYSQGFSYIWNEIPVIITFESDWRKAKQELLTIAQRHAAQSSSKARERIRRASKRYLIYYKNLTPIVYTKVIDHGITLTVRYLCAPQRRRSTTEAIWEDILLFVADEPTIEFAYPTQRIYYNPAEGPLELGPKDRSGARGSEGFGLGGRGTRSSSPGQAAGDPG